MFGHVILRLLHLLVVISAKTCKSLVPQVTDAWCDENCNADPPNCPASLCTCKRVVPSPSTPTPSPRVPTLPPSPAPPTPAPKWISEALSAIVDSNSPVLTVLQPPGDGKHRHQQSYTTSCETCINPSECVIPGLWQAIHSWDTSAAGKLNKFFSGTEKQNKYQVAAFLGNTYVESLSVFKTSPPFNPNYGISEIACDSHVGHNDSATGKFVQVC